MPSSATITAFYSFTQKTVIKSAEHNTNFSNFRGHFVPIDPNTATAATTKTYDLGSTDHYWRSAYIGQLNVDTISASSIVGTTATVTSLVATTATVTSLVATTATVTSLVATAASVGSLSATSATIVNLLSTTITTSSLIATTATVSSLIDLTGGKIKFPATQSASANANTLDDYEEGTWTPTLTASAGTITTYTSSGKYVVIGRVVYLSFICNITAIGTASGRIQIAGLPFTTDEAMAIVCRESTVNGNVGVYYVGAAATSGSIFKYDNGDVAVNGVTFAGSGTYGR